jgi:hypothetical protein
MVNIPRMRGFFLNNIKSDPQPTCEWQAFQPMELIPRPSNFGCCGSALRSRNLLLWLTLLGTSLHAQIGGATAQDVDVFIHSPGDNESILVDGEGLNVIFSSSLKKDDDAHEVCLGLDGRMLACVEPSEMQLNFDDMRLALILRVPQDVLESFRADGGGNDRSRHVLSAAIFVRKALQSEGTKAALAQAHVDFSLYSKSGTASFDSGSAQEESSHPQTHLQVFDIRKLEQVWGNVSKLLPSWPLTCSDSEAKSNAGFPRISSYGSRPVVVASWIKWFDTLAFDQSDISSCSVPCLFVHLPSVEVSRQCTEQADAILLSAAGRPPA